MNADAIRNVSGTAFWIAHQRALETRRSRALFRDPWAAALAGDRGAQVQLQLGPLASFGAWTNVTRTALLDERVLRGAAQGFDTVVNLGAGLDTRAFRLPLPAKLRWFDVDMPEIVEHKRSVLRDVRPQCQYQAIAADLSVGDTRRRTLEQCAAGARKVLVVTEGVLEYLKPESVRALALELHGVPAYAAWLLNLVGPVLLELGKSLRERLVRVNVDAPFTPAEGSRFFTSLGWREAEWASMITEARRLGCLPYVLRPVAALLRFMSAQQRDTFQRAMGVAWLVRSARAD